MTLAEDAVAIRRTRARGVADSALRRQLASVPTPRIRRFVFIRRVTIRAQPDQLGRAMQAALSRLAGHEAADILSFADFPALAAACARAALSGGLSAWHWRTLGLPGMAAPGDALATLLTAYPRDAGAAVAVLAAQGLLAAVWQSMTDPSAVRLTMALVQSAGVSVPPWPPSPAGSAPPDAAAGATGGQLAIRAAAFWQPVLAGLPARAEAVRTAAILSLLRWSPNLLRAPNRQVWPALLHAIHPTAARNPPPPGAALRETDSGSAEAVIAAGHAAAKPRPPDQASAAPPAAAPARAEAEAPPHGEVLSTAWGGVLFLINALRRLSIESVLDAEGQSAPTGWRLLHALGTAHGLPEKEPVALFLEAQDLDTTIRPALLAQLLNAIAALYRDGPWPLPLAQPATLRASETHLDLDLHAAAADLAVRLAGLDFDPGWVPWLGRVVSFHYPAMPVHHRRTS
jgi:hypothetical protein